MLPDSNGRRPASASHALRARASALPVLWPLLGLVLLALAWEAAGRFAVTSELLFAPLSSTLVALFRLFADGTIWPHLGTSAVEFAFGYVLAVMAGVSVGALFAIVPVLSRTFTPIVLGAYATPLIAVTPMVIALVGLGVTSKVVIVFLLAVFPIIITTESGLRSVDPDYVETAVAFGARQRQVLREVVFPAAMVTVIAGLRLAVARAIVGVVVGELFGAQAGLGFLIVQYSLSFQTAKTLALVVLLAAIGVLANAILLRIERRLSPWGRSIA